MMRNDSVVTVLVEPLKVAVRMCNFLWNVKFGVSVVKTSQLQPQLIFIKMPVKLSCSQFDIY